MNNPIDSDIERKRRQSDSLISYCHFCQYDKNQPCKISKSKSLSERQFFCDEKTNPKKISKAKSFTMSLGERQFFRCFSDIRYNKDNEKYSVCLSCNQKFASNNNKFCSLQCYKISKKDYNGIYHIKCKLCNKSFNTKCIFTDYCSQKCFQYVRQMFNDCSI